MSTNRLPPALALPRTSKRILLEWHERALDVLARWRASRRESRLPDFLIIGAQKCGTTYLYRKLVEHPLVLPALRKEVHFFDNGYRRGLAWYRGYFPVRAGADISGEASPYYFFHPHAPRRIKECVPGVKLILLLRHPVMRAYSHFHHEVRLGYERLTFSEALAQEECRLDGELERMLGDDNYYSYSHQHYAYRAKGLYAAQLEEWLALFAPDQLLVLQSERFYRDTPAAMRQVTDFLGLPEWNGWQFRASGGARYAPLEPEIRRGLQAYYHEHNRRLYDLMGADLGWNGEG